MWEAATDRGNSREWDEKQPMPVSTVICNIVSLNVSCGYGCNCPEKTANNCSDKMEHIRTSAGCPTASSSAWFYTSSNNPIPQGAEPSSEKPPTATAYLMKSLTKRWKTEGA